MSVQLASRKKKTTDVSIATVSTKKMEGMMRLKTNLDKAFFEEDLKHKALVMGLGYVDLFGYPIDLAHLTKISKKDALKYKVGVFNIEKSRIQIATTEYDPFLQQPIFADFVAKGYLVEFFLCSSESFAKLIKTYDYVISKRDNKTGLEIDPVRLEALFAQDLSPATVNKLLTTQDNLSVTNIFEILLVTAYKNQASDIHFEPEKENCAIRIRLDGVLHEFVRVDRDVQKKLESRVKIISNLKLNVDNLPQDGRFTFILFDQRIDVRVSLLPSNYGYSMVLRLLGGGNVALELDALGYVGLAKKRVMKEIARSQGLILATGPTGSGKTTSLYTILKMINTGETKIITLEDPIEYKLDGISQTQIDAEAGYTFAAGLRSILRQDPDVVMVGEIRDSDTAKTAIDAAMTGHKVLSTIHTNDAVGAIPRLMEMGVKSYALADSISMIMGQRLVRRLCKYCKHEAQLTPDQQEIVLDALNTLPPDHGFVIPQKLVFYTAQGCEHCNHTGYAGRVGAYEILTMTDGLRRLMFTENPSFIDMRHTAIAEGMVTMTQDAVIKALGGATDIGEIQRVIK
jgi:type IV pilus assembly protein PilB